jgi:hypothetical protein
LRCLRKVSQARRHRSIIPALSLDHEFEASLGYIARLSLKHSSVPHQRKEDSLFLRSVLIGDKFINCIYNPF